ncbi:STAS-like domain-containing protein [Acetobacter fabarum]|uniref:STAS-like domain-containing protein n=1 Tax=Acetobacter fabarum TaxID=483199 RepID=UPI0033B9B5BB
MPTVLKLFSGNEFLGGRHVAFVVRTKACELLTANPSSKIELDFEGVRGVSHSFSDELLSPLSELLGQEVTNHVCITHCDPHVADDLISVAELHSLFMPAISSDSPAFCK